MTSDGFTKGGPGARKLGRSHFFVFQSFFWSQNKVIPKKDRGHHCRRSHRHCPTRRNRAIFCLWVHSLTFFRGRPVWPLRLLCTKAITVCVGLLYVSIFRALSRPFRQKSLQKSSFQTKTSFFVFSEFTSF